MKHYVFCAASDDLATNKNLCAALKATRVLQNQFALDSDPVVDTFHSFIGVDEKQGTEGKTNQTEIYLENDDIHQLIADCMSWEREYWIQLDFINSLFKSVK